MPQDCREIVSPKSEFRRTVSSDGLQLELLDVSVQGYSNQFGGQAVFGPEVTTSTETNEDGDLHIDFNIEGGVVGSDSKITYTVGAGGYEQTYSFFHQNGVWDTRRSGDQVVRISSAFDDRIFSNNENVDLLTNWDEDAADWPLLDGGMPTLISSDSEFRKHCDEPVPYFSIGGPTTLRGPSDLFSGDYSVYMVLSWDIEEEMDFDVARLKQGDETLAAVVNDRGDIRVDGNSFHAPADVFVVELHSSGLSSINRNQRRSQGPLATSDGVVTLELNPEDAPIDLKFFELLAYNEDVSSGFARNPDKIAKQYSYLYNIDMTQSTRTIAGSPDIANHLFFEKQKNMYGFYTAGADAVKAFGSSSPIYEYDADREVTALDTDSQNFTYVSEAESVIKLTRELEKVFESVPHEKPVTGLSVDLEGFVYSSSADSSVVKTDPAGSTVWRFDEHDTQVNDVAAGSDGIYTAANWRTSDKNTVRKVNFSGEVLWENSSHLNDATSVVVDKNGLAATGSVNGEVRLLNDSGKEIWCYPGVDEPDSPRREADSVTVQELEEDDPAATVNKVVIGTFEEDTPTIGGIHVDVIESDEGDERGGVRDLAMTRDFVYIATTKGVDKVEKANGALVWRTEFMESSPAGVTVSPTGDVLVSTEEGSVSVLDDADGSDVSSIENVHEKVVGIQAQPGTFEPHWR